MIQLAVNGTLMSGLALNKNLVAVDAHFEREDQTAACYRLWSINNQHPAMQRCDQKGVAIDLEIWSIPEEGLATILSQEPPGLCVGKIELQNGDVVLGVLGEAHVCLGQTEITEFGGWRSYQQSL